MKILLILPEGADSVRFSIDNLRAEVGILPPLGLLYIASFLKQYPEYKVEVLDNQLDRLDKQRLRELIKERRPDVVGITCQSYHLYDTLNIAKAAKQASKEIVTVIGGPHTSVFPRETIGFPEVNYVILGEGEVSFYNLLEYLSGRNRGEELLDCGIIDKNNVRKNIFKKQIVNNLDSLPFPDRKLTDYNRYYNIMTKVGPTTSLVSSRGCPCSCSFCYFRGGKVQGPLGRERGSRNRILLILRHQRHYDGRR